MKNLILYSVILTILTVYNKVEAQFNTCASGESCIPHNQCEAVKILTANLPLTQEAREYLRVKSCNKVRGIHHFCCIHEPDSSHLPTSPACGTGLNYRIVNGEDTYIDEFPWFALIQYTKNGKAIGHHCGGSLINKQFVLTAAHCKTKIPSNWKLSKVRLGEWDIRTNPDCQNFDNEDFCNEPHVEVPVAEVIVHPDYHSIGMAQYNDIALLKLKREVEFTEWIRPICLPIDSRVRNMDFTPFSLEVIGYGITETNFSSSVKKRVELDGLTRAECQKSYNRRGVKILSTQFCAGSNDGRDSCKGDSGGPLMKYRIYPNSKYEHYMQVGLVSFGPKPCGSEELPGVYVRVADYMDWIIVNTRSS